MPTYDYQCRSCGRILEVIHPMNEDGPQTCEVCGGELRRVLHPAGIIFKGSGFYKTDSRSSGSASVSSKSKSTPVTDAAAPKGEGSGSTAKDSKQSSGTSSGGSSAPAD